MGVPLSPLHEKLNEAHHRLLVLHKGLLEYERVNYEREHGRIGSPGAFLQLLIGDPYFAWLRPMSMLITQIDEFVEGEEPAAAEGEALLAQARALLTAREDGSDFQRRVHRAVQESPEVAAICAGWKGTL